MSPFDTIEHALTVIAADGIVVVADDEDRENEGELIERPGHTEAAVETVNAIRSAVGSAK